LRLKPGPYQVHNNLGIALARSGRAAEALAAFRTAAALNPALPKHRGELGQGAPAARPPAEAADHFTRAERLRARRRPPGRRERASGAAARLRTARKSPADA